MADLDAKKLFIEFLKGINAAVLSTVSPENQPMSAMIYFISDDNLNFYFMSKNTMKTRNIESNNKVALLIGNEKAPVSAQVHGEVEKIMGGVVFDEKRDRLIQSMIHNSFSPPIFEVEGEEINIYKLTPTWIRWFDLRKPTEEKGFKQILP